MKKYVKLTLCGLAAMAVITGCSKKEETAETTTAAAETEAAETAAEITDFGKIVKLGDYKGVEVTKMDTTVTDDAVELRIDSILKANPEYIPVTDRPAQNGDVVDIDFVGMKDGEAFEGGTSEGYKLELGSGSFIDGFEDGLIGAEVGQELSLNLTFPENYGAAELAGQDVVFDVTVNGIDEVKDAVLDEAFVKRISDFDTVEEFRADILSTMQEEQEELAQKHIESDAYYAALNNSEYELNQYAVDQYYTNQMDYHNAIAQMYGFSLADYASAVYGKDEADFETYVREQAEDAVKEQLLIDAIVEAEQLVVEDADIEAVAEKMNLDVDTLKSSYGEDQTNEYALFFKVVDLIRDNAVVK
ncbi:MAG: trigger factor [Brotaphodocola sp.]